MKRKKGGKRGGGKGEKKEKKEGTPGRRKPSLGLAFPRFLGGKGGRRGERKEAEGNKSTIYRCHFSCKGEGRKRKEKGGRGEGKRVRRLP